jgi:hypothetical protein
VTPRRCLIYHQSRQRPAPTDFVERLPNGGFVLCLSTWGAIARIPRHIGQRQGLTVQKSQMMADKREEIERYEKQFGVIAIEKGFISSEQLIDALKLQVKEDLEYKSHRLVGEILLDAGHITPDQVQEVVNTIFAKSTLERG